MKARLMTIFLCLAVFLVTSTCIQAQTASNPAHPDSSAPSSASTANYPTTSDNSSSGEVSLLPPSAMPGASSHNSPTKSTAHGGEIGKVGIGVTASTLGAGIQLGVSIAPRVNLRGGASFFSYSRTFHYDGIYYKGNLDFRNGDVLLDVFPFGGGFHLSGGALIYNGNNVNATANAPAGQSFSLGSDTYYSSNANHVTGTGKLQFRKAAPELRFGWGNLVPRTRHFSFGIEAGIAFVGLPQMKLALSGTACLDAAQTMCEDAATNTTILSDIVTQQNKINDKAKYAQYWPILSIGFGYRF